MPGLISQQANRPEEWQELLVLPSAALHQVDHTGRVVHLETGTFTIWSVTRPNAKDESGIVASLGARYSWDVLPDSPTLKAGELTYTFALPGSRTFFHVTLSQSTPPDAQGVLEALLDAVSLFKESTALDGDAAAAAGEAALSSAAAGSGEAAAGGEAASAQYSHWAARALSSSSKRLASGVLYASTAAAGGIASYGKSFRERAAPGEADVSPALQKRIRRTTAIASWFAWGAGKVVSGLGWVSGKVADAVVSAVGADRLAIGGSGNAGAAGQAAHATVVGVMEVYGAMEEGARTVFLQTRETGVDCVNHKYGPQAGQLSAESFDVAGKTAIAAYGLRKVGPSAVARKVAKKTAKGVIKGWVGHKDGQQAQRDPEASAAADAVATPASAPGPSAGVQGSAGYSHRVPELR